MTPSPASDTDAELLESFVNTRRPPTARTDPGLDALASPAAAGRWLCAGGLLAPREGVGDDDLRRLVVLRESLRALMAAHNGAPADLAAADAWNALARRAQVHPALDASGHLAVRAHAHGADGAIGALVAASARLMADGTFARLKACRDPRCRWAYLDRSPNGSRAWCETSATSCGGRHKMRAYRARADAARSTRPPG